MFALALFKDLDGAEFAVVTGRDLDLAQIGMAAAGPGSDLGIGIPVGERTDRHATVAAAGNSLATANALSVGMNVVTGADSTKGVVLPASAAGKIVIVKSAQAGQTLPVYPPAASAINALAANSALTMAALTSAMFVCSSNTQWYTVPLLPS